MGAKIEVGGLVARRHSFRQAVGQKQIASEVHFENLEGIETGCQGCSFEKLEGAKFL